MHYKKWEPQFDVYLSIAFGLLGFFLCVCGLGYFSASTAHRAAAQTAVPGRNKRLERKAGTAAFSADQSANISVQLQQL